jgi:hypothetical protein
LADDANETGRRSQITITQVVVSTFLPIITNNAQTYTAATIQRKAWTQASRGQVGVRWAPKLIEKLGYLANEVESSDFQPTTQQVAVHDELKEQTATSRQRLKLILEQDVSSFNALLRQRNVPNILADMQ